MRSISFYASFCYLWKTLIACDIATSRNVTILFLVEVIFRCVSRIVSLNFSFRQKCPMDRFLQSRLVLHTPCTFTALLSGKFFVPSASDAEELRELIEEFVDLLRGLKPQYTTEFQLMKRLIYKNTSQHRGSKHFQRVKQVSF